MQIGLLLVCLAYPLLELAVLIKVGQAIGFWSTVLLLTGTGVVGGLILREQSFATMRRAMEAMRRGEPPIEPVVDSMMLMLAGVLLLLPGLISDVLGVLLLIPPVRRLAAQTVLDRMSGRNRTASRPFEGGRTAGGERRWPDQTDRRPGKDRAADDSIVIEGEWERIDDPANPPRRKPPPSPPRDEH